MSVPSAALTTRVGSPCSKDKRSVAGVSGALRGSTVMRNMSAGADVACVWQMGEAEGRGVSELVHASSHSQTRKGEGFNIYRAASNSFPTAYSRDLQGCPPRTRCGTYFRPWSKAWPAATKGKGECAQCGGTVTVAEVVGGLAIIAHSQVPTHTQCSKTM